MPRPPFYLLALLLSFIATLLWYSSGSKTSTQIFNLAHGSCSCADGAPSDATPSSTPASTPTPFSKGIKPIVTPSPAAAAPVPASLQPPTQPEQSYYLPFTPSQQLARLPFPSKLWQKAGPNGIDEERQINIQSWQTQNPSLRHEIFTDGNAAQYVREKFAKFPDIIDLYQDLHVPILKADFLRQLILYADGGVWSDLDVTCHQPIDSWIPPQYKNQTNLVVGLEFDGNQFASWTVMAKPKTSHIAAVIEYIMDQLEYEAELANTTVAGLTMKTISDVVLVTGPQAMTQGILQSVSLALGEKVDGGNVSNLHEPVLLHDVLVLPNAAFAAMQGDWPKDQGPYLVEHHYAGSWKNDHGGEKSASGEVEQNRLEELKAITGGDREGIKTEIREGASPL